GSRDRAGAPAGPASPAGGCAPRCPTTPPAARAPGARAAAPARPVSVASCDRRRAAAEEEGCGDAGYQADQVALPADARLGGGYARQNGAAPDGGDQDGDQDAERAPLHEARG